jgi:hypothetical protein
MHLAAGLILRAPMKSPALAEQAGVGHAWPGGRLYAATHIMY